MLDVVIHGGAIADGTGAPRFRADVGIEDGKIVAIGHLGSVQSGLRLDATGMLVAPGFIDIHSHSDFTLLVDPRAQSSIAQGVTTEVIGNCGHGCAPITEPDRFKGNIYGYTPEVEIDWVTMAEYLDRLEVAHPAVNVATLVPNGNLRLAVAEELDRPSTPQEVSRMGRLLEEALEAGAFGYSTGLESVVESACSEEETTQLCRIVARAGGLYATHERDKGLRAVEAVEEGIRVAEASGVRLQVSHIIPRRGSPPGSLERAMDAVQKAHDRGMDAGFDAHTRLHGITKLSDALPAWAFEGGPEKLAARLRDATTRAKFRRTESLISKHEIIGWDRVILYSSHGRPELAGKSFQELAPPGGDVFDVMFDVLLAECEDPHRSLVTFHSYEEEWLRETFRHPLCTLESDATALGTDGPLAGAVFLGAYTWAAWFFRRFVREMADFTVEEGVRKLTAAPAARLGLTDRGRIKEGAPADVVVFDPARFGERGTLEDPNQLATGVAHVVVNGEVAMEDGAFTDNRNGTVLRRR